MNMETTSIIGTLVACLVISGSLMYAGRQYLRPRKKGESMREFVTRATDERRLDKEAAAQMHGRWTPIYNLVSWLLLFGVAYSYIINPVLNTLGYAYLVLGLILSRIAAKDAQPPNYSRLSFFSRIEYRIFHAWLWPFYVLRRSKA